MSRRFWALVWSASEALHINLGPAAPWVFGKMIGRKGRRVQ